jgi:hypothetical protein
VLVGERARVVAGALDAAVRDDDGLRATAEHVVDRGGRQVREVDGDAERLHARDESLPRGR